MTFSEIMAEIYREGLQINVYQELSRWLLEDRQLLKGMCSDYRATLKTTRKIIYGGAGARGKLEAILNLCDEAIK